MDTVYIVRSTILVDGNDAEDDIVDGRFFETEDAARARMREVFDQTVENLKDEHDLTDCEYSNSGTVSMGFSADDRVSFVVWVESHVGGPEETT